MSHESHVSDYFRILYKRRWVAALMFLVVFVYGSVNSLKKTPIYEARTQLLIDVEMRRRMWTKARLNHRTSRGSLT